MSVVRFLFRLLLGLFAIVGGVVVILAVGSAVAWRYFPTVEHRVPNEVVLTLDLADGITERGAAGPLAWTSSLDGPRLTGSNLPTPDEVSAGGEP